jgi:hypothetical protein
VATVLDAVDGLAVEATGLCQLFLRPLATLLQGGEALAEACAVLRKVRVDSDAGTGATLVRAAVRVRTNDGTTFRPVAEQDRTCCSAPGTTATHHRYERPEAIR